MVGDFAGCTRPQVKGHWRPFHQTRERSSGHEERRLVEVLSFLRRSADTKGADMEKPTQEQIDELKRLSRETRVEDWSEIVQSRQEAEIRIKDLKQKARME